MKIVDEEETRVIDTFAARELHDLEPQVTIESYIDFAARARYNIELVQDEPDEECVSSSAK